MLLSLNFSESAFRCLFVSNSNSVCHPEILFGQCWHQSEFGVTQNGFCPITKHRIVRTCTQQGWLPALHELEMFCYQSLSSSTSVKYMLDFIGCPLSILICLFAFCFIFFRRTLRDKFYHQLSLSLYLNLMLFASFSLTVTILKNNELIINLRGTACAIFQFFYLYFSLCRFSCLCAEGVYLYQCLSHPFHQSKRTLKIIFAGQWLFPLPIVLTYLLGVSLSERAFQYCFRVNNFMYIIDVPVIVLLVLNLTLAVYVLRVAWRKLKQMAPTSSDYENKATSSSGHDYSAEDEISPAKFGKKYIKSFFARQRNDYIKWFRMSRSSIVVCITLGLHFLPSMIPQELFEKHSSTYLNLVALNAVIQSFTGAIVCLMSFLLKPDVYRLLKMKSCNVRTYLPNRCSSKNGSRITSSPRNSSDKCIHSSASCSQAGTLQTTTKSDSVWFSESSIVTRL